MEIVVVSGKGGTGKTTVAAGISQIFKNNIRIDCDVDAANFHLYYKHHTIHKESFIGGNIARIDETKCVQCGECTNICKFDAIQSFSINEDFCEGCGACELICPENAIVLKQEETAEVLTSALLDEENSPNMVRAKMKVGSDGSGKLITRLKRESQNYSEPIKIVDGSPGIGCPVIATLTGADIALIVTEPTQSGFEDMKRVFGLSQHFGIQSYLCINKFDLNIDVTEKLEAYAKEQKLEVLGRIPYDECVSESINSLIPITNFKESMAGHSINEIGHKLKEIISHKEEIV